jgi:integrase
MSNEFGENGGLPAELPDSTVSLATPSFTGTKGIRIVPKRRFQKGTFVKRNGHWVGMWRVDVLQLDGTIRREQRSKTFVGLSERAARAAFQPILDSVNAASGATPPVPKRTATLNAVIREWREQVAGTLKPSTRKTAQSHLRRHIEPMLGDCALPELTTKRLQSFVTTLATTRMANGKERTRKTIENILLTLSSIVSTARAWGYTIPTVSLSDLCLPQDTPRQSRFFVLRDLRRIVRAADEPLGAICFLLSVTGMRIGEVLALRVQDLDFHRKLIKVRCSTYAGQIGTPKSKASIGDLPMPPALESRLKRYLSSRHFRENDLGLLFANRRGRPYSANKLREKKLHPLLTRLRIPLAGFHAFRHAVASELIDSGAPITVVQAQLRHSDPRITLGLYGHVIPQSQRDALGSLAARLANARRRTGLQLLTRPRIADSAA